MKFINWIKNIWKWLWNWILDRDIISKEQFDNYCDNLKNKFDEIDQDNNKWISQREFIRYIKKLLKKLIEKGKK